jgi:hypothetical protein
MSGASMKPRQAAIVARNCNPIPASGEVRYEMKAMFPRGALFGLIVAALAMLYTGGATTAAFACAMPQMTTGALMDYDNSNHSDLTL